MDTQRLDGKVALVTGGSRGIGKGVAQHLSSMGAVVYVTGRTVQTAGLPSGCIAVPCDHTDDLQVTAVFDKIASEYGRLDILVNNAWGGYERMVENGVFNWGLPFWEQPLARWDAMFDAGVRAAYVASRLAALSMVPRRAGLIVNISFWAAQKHIANVAYGVSKAATDKLCADTAHELRKHNVSVVSLYPGLVRTEKVMEAAAYLNLTNSESPQFIGRVIAALAADPDILAKSGRVLVAAAQAIEYNIVDIDGKKPAPLVLEQV